MTPFPETPVENNERFGRAWRWTIGGLISVYGLIILDRDSLAWNGLSLLLFTAPLLLQATGWIMTRTYALWGGVLLVTQSLLSPILGSAYVSLPPNLHSSVDVRTTEAPGMQPGLSRITTDALGYRVQPPVDYDNRTRTRLFAIGGSTTEDIMLDDRRTWTHLLQEDLKRHGHDVEVINTGVSGLRARNHLATFNKVRSLQPDIVLILVGGNDWNRHIRRHFEPDWDTFRPANLRKSALGQLLARVVVQPLRAKLQKTGGADLNRVVSTPDGINADKPRFSLDRPVKHTFRPEDVSSEYRRDMESLAEACIAARVTCVWITQPHAYSQSAPQSLRDLYWMTPPYGSYTLDLDSMLHVTRLYNRYLLEFAKRHGHASCDLAAEMEANRRLFFDDMHYTDEGAQRIAQILLPCMKDVIARTPRRVSVLRNRQTGTSGSG